ncbi:hypothetical protein AAFF_G00349350 [Aldrovandia affinis]|uniref:Uncharacterized protein n=1 Tax=Aldrovandia affinis TaxID=143900 RepID=A0AAD7SJ65_9TELE|nr:hypothetical protein AAFF_G00349350 [Aldrovandia affinis]
MSRCRAVTPAVTEEGIFFYPGSLTEQRPLKQERGLCIRAPKPERLWTGPGAVCHCFSSSRGPASSSLSDSSPTVTTALPSPVSAGHGHSPPSPFSRFSATPSADSSPPLISSLESSLYGGEIAITEDRRCSNEVMFRTFLFHPSLAPREPPGDTVVFRSVSAGHGHTSVWCLADMPRFRSMGHIEEWPLIGSLH